MAGDASTENTEAQQQQEGEPTSAGLFAESNPAPAPPPDDGPKHEEPAPVPGMSEAMERLAAKEREVLQAQSKIKELKRFEELAENKDPDAILDAFGIDKADYLYGRYMKEGEEDADGSKGEGDPALRKKVEELEAKEQQRQQEQQQAQLQDQTRAHLTGIGEQINSISGDVPLLSAALKRDGDMVAGQILTGIKAVFEKTQQVPDPVDVIKRAEKIVESRVIDDMKTFGAIPGVREKLIEALGLNENVQSGGKERKPTKTLSGGIGAGTGTVNVSELSEEEADAWMAQKLNGIFT